MHLFSKENPAFRRRLDALADEGGIRLVVGAGASVGAGLPAWRDFVSALMAQGITKTNHSLSIDQAKDLTNPILSQQGLAAGASVARVLHGQDRDDAMRDVLYKSGEPLLGAAGPVALAIAELIAVYEPAHIEVLTTNYDNLLERAINASGLGTAAVPTSPDAPGRRDDQRSVVVEHLHGYVPPTGQILGPIILDEGDFALHGRHPIERLVDCLSEPGALFLGMGFTDPNVTTAAFLAALRQAPAVGHYGLFVREPGRQTLPTDLAGAISGRLENMGISPIWLKSYGQVWQFLVELGVRRAHGPSYWDESSRLRYGCRLEDWRNEILERWPHDRDSFATTQSALSDELHELCESIEVLMGDLAGERFGVDLWVRQPDEDGLGSVQHWATSVRVHRHPWSLAPNQRIEADSTFPASRCLFYGAPQVRDLDNVQSRWQYMVAVPVVLPTAPWHQLPVGAITLSSTRRRSESILRSPHRRREIESVLQSLANRGASLLDPHEG